MTKQFAMVCSVTSAKEISKYNEGEADKIRKEMEEMRKK